MFNAKGMCGWVLREWVWGNEFDIFSNWFFLCPSKLSTVWMPFDCHCASDTKPDPSALFPTCRYASNFCCSHVWQAVSHVQSWGRTPLDMHWKKTLPEGYLQGCFKDWHLNFRWGCPHSLAIGGGEPTPPPCIYSSRLSGAGRVLLCSQNGTQKFSAFWAKYQIFWRLF